MENQESNEALHEQLQAVVAEMLDAGISPNEIKGEVDSVASDRVGAKEKATDEEIQTDLAAYISAHKMQYTENADIEALKTFRKKEWENYPVGTATSPEYDEKGGLSVSFKGSDQNLWIIHFGFEDFSAGGVKYVDK